MSDAYIGEIRLFAGNFPPKDWAFCDGSLLAISRSTALFSVLGTRFGGDGKVTFALPNLIGHAAMSQGAGAGLTPREVGDEVGIETVTLEASELPAHSHTAMGIPGNSNQSSNPEQLYWGETPSQGHHGTRTSLYTAAAPNTMMHPMALGMSGGNQTHNNMQPYLALNYIICVNGIYPARSS